MRLRVAVVDGESLARDRITWRLRVHDDVTVTGEYGDGRSALAGILTGAFDLVFMEVQMPQMNGLEVLAAIPVEKRPISIFLTAHDNFAVRAFELEAVDYLLKPVGDERFSEALQRARKTFAHRREDVLPSCSVGTAVHPYLAKFSVRVGRRTLIVDTAEVDWIGADGDYATLHAGQKTYLVRESIQRLCASLDPALFVRVHRSAIVRADLVAELQPLSNRDALLRLRDGTPLRVSRTYIDQLVSVLRGQ